MTAKKRSKSAQKKKQKSLRLHSSWRIFLNAFKVLRRNYKIVLGIAIIHIAISLLFSEDATTSGSGFVALFTVLIISLAYIWILREDNKKTPHPSLQTALYEGPFQIVPFLLLTLLILVQLLPLMIGAFIFQIGVGGGVAVFLWEKILFGFIWGALALPSVYWVTSTLFALLVVAIPGVKPMEAWRAAKKLVRPFLFATAGRLVSLFTLVLAILLGFYLAAFSIENQAFLTYGAVALTVLLLPVIWAYIFETYKNLLQYE